MKNEAFEKWWSSWQMTTHPNYYSEEERNIAQDAWNACQQILSKEQEEIIDMCIVSWISTEGTLKEKVCRLIDCEVSIALDPAVSSAAQALIERGKKEANIEMAVRLIDGLADRDKERLFAGKHDKVTYNAYLIAREILKNKQ